MPGAGLTAVACVSSRWPSTSATLTASGFLKRLVRSACSRHPPDKQPHTGIRETAIAAKLLLLLLLLLPCYCYCYCCCCCCYSYHYRYHHHHHHHHDNYCYCDCYYDDDYYDDDYCYCYCYFKLLLLLLLFLLQRLSICLPGLSPFVLAPKAHREAEERKELELQAALSGVSLCKTRGSFRKLGVPYFGVLIIGILLFRVLY